uniref:Transposase, Ptta/En/Spm, plant n=1 Tax=Davidia involucrata TaxID=16924 RepID=A0A5B6ZQ58_DAVIN
MTHNEWDSLLELWNTPSHQAKCETNKRNRSMLKVHHRTGSRSFVSARHEMRDKETEEEPNRIEFYLAIYYKEGNGWSCSEAEDKYNLMKEMQSEQVAEGEISLTSDQIVDCVLGTKSGYVKGLGYGPKPTTSGSSSMRNAELQKTLRKTQEDASRVERELKDQIEAQ